jgi:RNA polymerase sigma factor (sigma-70 family)
MLQERARPPLRPPKTELDLAALVRAAAAGDELALTRLVERFDHGLRCIARSYRLGPWDVDDVVQATWLQFLRHGGSLREPAAVGGWLATTARRESLRVLQCQVREYLADEPDRAAPDRELIDAERRELVHAALAELPDRPRRLLRVLIARPELSYAEVGRMLDMPIGSIGPTRARALDRLAESSELQALHAARAQTRDAPRSTSAARRVRSISARGGCGAA